MRNESVLMTLTLDRVYDISLDYCVISNNALVLHEIISLREKARRQIHIAVQIPKGMASLFVHTD